MRSLSLCALSVLACLSLTSPVLAEAQVPPSGKIPTPETGIAGSLLDPDYEPLSGYRLQFLSEDGSVVRESPPIDVMGRFSVPDLPPGVYEVRIVTGDGRPCEASIPPVEISESGTARLTTILPEMPVCQPAPKIEKPKKPAEPPPPPSNLKPGLRRWVIIGSTVGAVGLALLLSEDDDPPPMSPMSP